MKKLPVTVISGFLGSGKTTLLQHILNHKDDKKIAMIVNDMAEVNIDGATIGDKIIESKEKLVEIQNGCICCTLREDLFEEVKRISEEGKYDYLVIEASGISEPLPVAATFTFDIEEGKNLHDLAKLDTMVTVLDASHFASEYYTTDTLKKRKQEVDEEDDRRIIDLLIDQVEFANVILVNKTDLVSEEELKKIHQIIRSLNAEAKIIDTEKGNVDVKEIMNTDLFDFDKAQEYPTWIKEIDREVDHTPETEEYGISSFVYKARKPFHPRRFFEYFDEMHEGLLRAKGHFWLSNRNDDVCLFQLAGKLISYSIAGGWWANVKKEEWPEQIQEQMKDIWEEKVGDRRQEIVFIGDAIDKEKMTKELDECLIKDDDDKNEDFSMYDEYFPKVEE